MQRRRVLQAIVAGTTLAVAGCSGAGGGDDGSNGDATTESPSSPEAGTSGTGNGSTSTDETTTPTENASGGSDGPTLGSLDVAFEDSYRFSVSVPQMQAPVTGAFDGGNFYSVVSIEGDTITTYVIEGENYVVAEGFCTQVPNSPGGMGGVDVDSLTDADTIEQEFGDSAAASLVPSGTATVDGERMYVYEFEGQPTTTYYVGVESRRLGRVETQGVVLEYSDWGTVEPITAPC